jgi:hypothetical protein
MSDGHSDALVFFGATGDLAYKKIFPALQAMVKRGHLDVPVSSDGRILYLVKLPSALWYKVTAIRMGLRSNQGLHYWTCCGKTLYRTK